MSAVAKMQDLDIDSLMAEIGLVDTPAAEAVIDQAAAEVSDTLMAAPANQTVDVEEIDHLLESVDLDFSPEIAIGEDFEIANLAVELDEVASLPALAAVASEDIEAERQAMREAHDVIAENDAEVDILTKVYQTLANGDADSALLTAELTAESVAAMLNSTGMANSELMMRKVEMARAKARDLILNPPAKRGRKKKVDADPSQAGDEAKPVKAKKEPKEKADKPAKAVEMKPVSSCMTYVTGIEPQLQKRTKMIVLPDGVLWEGAMGRGPKNRHQIDFSRPEGYAPVMPCMKRLADTLNPYPSDDSDPVVQPSAEKWRPFVKLSFNVWQVLSDALGRGEGVETTEEFYRAVANNVGMTDNNETRACIYDTLRDLWSVGLVEQLAPNGEMRGRKRIFKIKS